MCQKVEKTYHNRKSTGKRSAFDFLTELISWFQIMLSPFLVGFIAGVIVYFYNPGKTNLVVGLLLTGLGLAVGIIWATKVSKRRGATQFMARTMATPELDNQDEESR